MQATSICQYKEGAKLQRSVRPALALSNGNGTRPVRHSHGPRGWCGRLGGRGCVLVRRVLASRVGAGLSQWLGLTVTRPGPRGAAELSVFAARREVFSKSVHSYKIQRDFTSRFTSSAKAYTVTTRRFVSATLIELQSAGRARSSDKRMRRRLATLQPMVFPRIAPPISSRRRRHVARR